VCNEFYHMYDFSFKNYQNATDIMLIFKIVNKINKIMSSNVELLKTLAQFPKFLDKIITRTSMFSHKLSFRASCDKKYCS
jgi:hypothetical protein